MSQSKYLETLQPNQYYHVYNRSNNKEFLYKNEGNKYYFLQKYKQYLSGYLKTYAYCLLDTHFHLLVQVRSEEEMVQTIQAKAVGKRKKVEVAYLSSFSSPSDQTGFQNLSGRKEPPPTHTLISKQFQDFFNAYSKAFNKQHRRNGNLFNRPFKRVAVADDAHFTQLIYYIHANPSLHRIYRDFTNYSWSSYQSLLSNQPTLLERKAVIAWFGNKDNFRSFHQTQRKLHIQNLMIEET